MAEEGRRAILQLLTTSSSLFASRAASLSSSSSSSSNPPLAPLPSPAPTSDHILSDLSALLPSLRHDVTALSLALSTEDVAGPAHRSEAAFSGALSLLGSITAKADKCGLAASWWPPKRGKLKGRSLRWSAAEVFEALAAWCSAHARHLAAPGGPTRQEVLRHTKSVWEAADRAAGAARGTEQDAVNSAWSDMAKTVADALEEATELQAPSPAPDSDGGAHDTAGEHEGDNGEDDDDDDDDDDDPLGLMASSPLAPVERDRVAASVPLLKLTRLLFVRMPKHASTLARLTTAELDGLFDATEPLVAGADDLVAGLPGPQDADALRTAARALAAQADRVAGSIPPGAGEEDAVEDQLAKVSLTGGEESGDGARRNDAQAQDKEQEWLNLWVAQVHKAVAAFVAI